MSYVRHTWVNDEYISYDKLNNIEDGIEEAAQSGGGGAVIVNILTNTSSRSTTGFRQGDSLEITFANLFNYLKAGTPVYAKLDASTSAGAEEYDTAIYIAPVLGVYKYNDTYRVMVDMPKHYGTISSVYNMFEPSIAMFGTSGANSYPEFLRYVYPSAVTSSTNA